MKKRLAMLACFVALVLFGACAQASVKATLTARMATRSGPGTQYTEMGTYFSKGKKVTAVSRYYDSRNNVWWIQVEFKYRNAYRRAYTGRKRMNVISNKLPEEKLICTASITERVVPRYGPGETFESHTRSIAEGTTGKVYQEEDGWTQFEYKSSAGKMRRVWVPNEYIEAISYAEEEVIQGGDD